MSPRPPDRTPLLFAGEVLYVVTFPVFDVQMTELFVERGLRVIGNVEFTTFFAKAAQSKFPVELTVICHVEFKTGRSTLLDISKIIFLHLFEIHRLTYRYFQTTKFVHFR